MAKLELYVMLLVTYLFSLALLALDIAMMYRYDANLFNFYLMTNATLIYRLFGLHFITIPIHVGVYVYVLMQVYLNYYGHLTHIPHAMLLLTILIQISFTIPIFMTQYLRRSRKETWESELHALIGILVIIVFFWTVCFNTKRVAICGCLTMSYMLLYLFLILTPQFHGLGGAAIREIRESKGITEEIAAVSPGHRRIVRDNA